jgi:glycosyltransferase involved in cell wall biosynthesis
VRVWHLCSNRWNSAVTEYALSAARALALAGHPGVFTPLAASPAEARAREHLETRPVANFGALDLRELTALARELRPDLILTYGGPETFLSKLLRRQTGARVVRFRGQAVGAGGPLGAARSRLQHAHVDLVLTPSESLAKEARRIESVRVESVPLGLDASSFARSAPAPRSVGAGRPELVVLGRLDPVKGHATLLKIFTGVLKEWPSAWPRPLLHIVGEPANLSAAHITHAAAAAGVAPEDYRLTTGRVADVAGLLSRATLGVIPSLGSEIICRVAEEFLLCGTPVAVSGVGSLSEVLIDETMGVTWRGLGDVAAAAALTAWLQRSTDEGEASKAARAARARAAFSLEAMGAALLQALR